MTAFYDFPWSGYKIKLRPYELIRRLIKYHSSYLPYMDEQSTTLRVFVIPPKNLNIPENIKLSWTITDKDNPSHEYNSQDELIINIKPRKTFKTTINTKLILSSAKLVIKFKIEKLDKNELGESTVGVLSVKDRADTFMILVPIIISVIAAVISIISIIISIKTGNNGG
jgi:hypothetical protein